MAAPAPRHDEPDLSGEYDITGKLDEQLLAERLRSGDVVAFEAVFRQYYRELHDLARRIAGCQAAAEDVIQDVFLALWLARERLRVTTSLGAYLRRSVRNAALRRAAQRMDRTTPLDPPDDERRPAPLPLVAPDPSPLDHAEHASLVDDMARAAAALPPRARQVFTLSRHEQLTNREIAERLTLSPKTVEMHLTRALTALRAVLRR